MPKTITGGRPELRLVNSGAAAIDIGSRMHMAAVDPTCTETPVRAFGTFTQNLHDLAILLSLAGPQFEGSRPDIRRSTAQLRVEPCGLSREVVAFGEAGR